METQRLHVVPEPDVNMGMDRIAEIAEVSHEGDYLLVPTDQLDAVRRTLNRMGISEVADQTTDIPPGRKRQTYG